MHRRSSLLNWSKQLQRALRRRDSSWYSELDRTMYDWIAHEIRDRKEALRRLLQATDMIRNDWTIKQSSCLAWDWTSWKSDRKEENSQVTIIVHIKISTLIQILATLIKIFNVDLRDINVAQNDERFCLTGEHFDWMTRMTSIQLTYLCSTVQYVLCSYLPMSGNDLFIAIKLSELFSCLSVIDRSSFMNHDGPTDDHAQSNCICILCIALIIQMHRSWYRLSI